MFCICINHHIIWLVQLGKWGTEYWVDNTDDSWGQTPSELLIATEHPMANSGSRKDILQNRHGVIHNIWWWITKFRYWFYYTSVTHTIRIINHIWYWQLLLTSFHPEGSHYYVSVLNKTLFCAPMLMAVITFWNGCTKFTGNLERWTQYPTKCLNLHLENKFSVVLKHMRLVCFKKAEFPSKLM
jgi:hypothetical protein